ncbi:hypothetical protein TNCV_3093521 [Trichonephila clavipes]|nr:hypothetical protein TNCV_3093521 [Trichonephila clavipes]
MNGTDDVALSSVSPPGILFTVWTLQGSNPNSGGSPWSFRLVLISVANVIYRYPEPLPKCHVEKNKAMLPNTRFISSLYFTQAAPPLKTYSAAVLLYPHLVESSRMTTRGRLT